MRYKLFKPVFFIVGLLIIIASCTSKDSKPAKTHQESKSEHNTFTKPVIDQWLRTDGDYVLDIKGFNADTTIDVAYLNPNSINISETRWKVQEGYLYFYILFDDEGYPGSYYSLGYIPEDDKLFGIYYQAVQQQQYEIVFERK